MDDDGGITELLSSPATFVDARLAELYDVDADFGDDGWARVTLPDSQGRGGLLGHAGFLAINAFAERTSPTRLRGALWRRRVRRGPVRAFP